VRSILDPRFLQCGVIALLRSVPEDVHERLRKAEGPGWIVYEDEGGDAGYDGADGYVFADWDPIEDGEHWWLPADAAEILRLISGSILLGDGLGQPTGVSLDASTDPRNGRITFAVIAVSGENSVELTDGWSKWGYPTAHEAVLRAAAWLGEFGRDKVVERLDDVRLDREERRSRTSLIRGFRSADAVSPEDVEEHRNRVRSLFVATGLIKMDEGGQYVWTDDGMKLIEMAERERRPTAPQRSPVPGDFDTALYAAAGHGNLKPVAGLDRYVVCQVPPPGWRCTREPGHDGSCAAVPDDGNEDGYAERGPLHPTKGI
jgi:hypothetical protein